MVRGYIRGDHLHSRITPQISERHTQVSQMRSTQQIFNFPIRTRHTNYDDSILTHLPIRKKIAVGQEDTTPLTSFLRDIPALSSDHLLKKIQ